MSAETTAPVGTIIDVVVIGAGHNGLVAANYLADAGRSVLVVEATERIGGMTASGQTIPGAPDHLAHHYSFDPFFWDSFPPSRELSLDQYGLRRVRVDPGLVYLDPDDDASIAFWEDPAKTAAEIGYFSTSDGRAYIEFAGLLQAFSDVALAFALANPTRFDVRPVARTARHAWRHRRRLRDIVTLAMGSAAGAIAERFSHPVVRNAMNAVAGSTIPNSSDGSGAGFLWLANQHRHSHRHPIGGIQSLADALERRLRLRGGSVMVNSAVVEILLRDGSAVGVRLADGRELESAEGVLAACDPRAALERLLPSGTLSQELETRARNIAVGNNNYGQMKVDLAFSGRLSLERFERRRGDGVDLRRSMHVLATEAGIERAFARSAAGLVPHEDDFSMWNVIPTGVDPSQAPEGQDNFYCYLAVAPYRPEGGWEQVKEQAGQAAVNKLAKFYEGVDELEIGRQVLTNEDIRRMTGASGGNITHVDMVLSRSGPLRPARGLAGYRTPVPGLYLGSAGSHPGGGITGAPGYMAARELLRDGRSASRR